MKTLDQLNKMAVEDLAGYYNGLVKPANKLLKFTSKQAGIKRIIKVQKELTSAAKNAEVTGQKKATTPAPAKKKTETPKADPAAPRASTVYTQKKGRKSWVEHRSVKSAFEALDLPLGVHQIFRKKLKANGVNELGGFSFESSAKHNG